MGGFSTKSKGLSDSTHIDAQVTDAHSIAGDQTLAWPGLRLFVRSLESSQTSECHVPMGTNVVLVHLAGRVTQLRCTVDGQVKVFDPPPIPGDTIVLPGGTKAEFSVRGDSLLIASLHLEPNNSTDLGTPRPTLPSELRLNLGNQDDFIRRLVMWLIQLSREDDPLAASVSLKLSEAILLHAFRVYSSQDRVSALGVRKRRALRANEESAVQQYVAQHLPGTITLQQLCSLLGRKPHTLLRAFRASFGTTPAQYVINQRLRRACGLLLESNKDISVIAREVGFSSHAHLATAFRKRMRMTPLEFRLDRAAGEALIRGQVF